MSIFQKISIFILTAFLSFTVFSFSGHPKPVSALEKVKVDGGFISGGSNTAGDVHFFKGIPFAAPPLGNLRWKEPQPVKPWDGTRTCTTFGPSPMQASPAPFSMWSQEFLIPKEPISEDCLYLNVWSGAKSSGEKRPVLVWIYGGGFVSGGTAAPIYDGEAMAKKGIIFVSVNYRVGIFGFFVHPELTKESGRNASGNYALMDLLAGLKWVQRNIAAFGGDPGNVTIAGQSAGSFAVNALVASPLGKGLFEKAIGESGASFSNRFQPLAKAEEAGIAFAKLVNATSIEDLRKIPADELQKKPTNLRGPIIDGYVLPDGIRNIFEAAKENKVSLLTGWNKDEGLGSGTLKNLDGFQKDINQRYGADAAKMLSYYPATTDAEAEQAQKDIGRDMTFGIQNYTWANMQSDHGAKVYMYSFAHRVPGTGEYAKYGAFHTGEVPYAYDNLSFVNRPWTSVDHNLARIMSSYWANFVISGDPNGKGLPQWPAYKRTDKKIMILGDEPAAAKLPNADALEFLAARMNMQ